eukprot:NODE_3220_length_925_cov_181.934837_g3199_i0.p1 GENE.NODE_3220_length_925_cov_181.934837_g3199_i0~~NODE_3220_length_925_cov_181.934837_g3199_i0.p1  ORF type:complete len:251 (+),score=46.95 NODE_3220_length_925_cov_181.934837_g3199_i0:55-807(+)
MARFLVYLLLLSLLATAWAQEDEVEEMEDELDVSEEGDGQSAEGVNVKTIFPSHPSGQFPAGSQVEALVGFDNDGEQPFNVEYIRASLTSPQDRTYFIQNYTGSMYNTSALSGEESCMLYRFKPDANLDPREYGFVLEVFYSNEENETFVSVAYNSTIDIADPESSFDGQTLFAYLTAAGMLGLAGFGASKKFAGKKRAPRPARSAGGASATTGASKHGEIDMDYVDDIHRKIRASNSPPRKASRSPKRK